VLIVYKRGVKRLFSSQPLSPIRVILQEDVKSDDPG
jgi:hypothetical protein